MAEPIVRKFILDTGDSEQKLKELGDQLKGIPNDLPKNKVPGDIVPPEAINNAKSLRAQLKELQAQLANTDPQTAKYQELSAAAGELKDKISDAAQAIGTQAGGAFEKVSGSLGLVTSRIASLDFEGAAEGAKLLAKNITEIKPGDIANGVKGIGSAFASIGKALLTNPIFLIGAAIAAAVVYADELLSLVDGVTDAELEQLDIQKQRAAQSKQQLDDISQQENLLRLQGKSEREILNLKIAKANQAILEQKSVITTLEVQRQAQIDAAERNRKITSGIIQFLTLPIQVLLGTVDEITKGLNAIGVISNETFASIGNQRDKFNTSLSTLVFDPAEVAEEGNAAIEEQKKILQQLENTQAGFQLSIQAIDKKAADDRQKERDKELENEQKLSEQIIATRKKTAEQSAAITKKIREDAAKPVDSAKSEVSDFDAEIKAQRDAEELRISVMEEGVEKEIALADLKFARLRDAAGADAELRKQIAQQNEDAIVEIVKNAEEKKRQEQLETAQKGLEYGTQGIQALTNLSDIYFAGRLAAAKKGSKEEEALAKRQFAINKKLQLAGAIIDAGKAILTSLSNSPVAIGPVPNPIGIASLAFVSLASAANIAKIASTKFEGGSTSPDTPTPSLGGGGGGDNSTQPAQFNPLAAQFVNNRPDQYPPRAYVLAGDVSSQQEVRENVEDLARIG
jgi:hypothetical protein